MDPPSESVSLVRTTKRKLEDAIRTLDEAIVPSLTAFERPTPSKRPHLTRSVYSTLAKFGGKSRERTRFPSHGTPAIDVSKSAPHLSAILARSESQSRQALPSNDFSVPRVHPASEYRPSSVDSLLFRLVTYKITTYANKPPQIDAVSAAMCGWINDGKDRLVCGICDVSWVLAGREGMTKDAANVLVEKQRTSLVEMHKDGCPWKTRQCDPSIYRVPAQAPTPMVHQLTAAALSLEPVLASVAVKHPLTPSEQSSLQFIFAAAFQRLSAGHDSVMGHRDSLSMVPSATAIFVALFGWILAPTAARNELRSTPSSISRAGSYCRSASIPPTPALSRTNSVLSHFRESTGTPAPSVSPRMSISQFHISPERAMGSSRVKNPPSSSSIVTSTSFRDAPLVYCVLCQRRVGLWRFLRNEASTTSGQDDHSAPASREDKKEFDLVKEHRSYCPYIVCSSVVPSFSHSPTADLPGSAMEGWRAVLTIVQRYELGQRQHLSRFLHSDDPDCHASSAELKGVRAMVAGVKNDGGRELLKYVKNVLG